MIKKSFEILKNESILIKNNIFLIYGENIGLKKDIKESIKKAADKADDEIELLILYENDIISNDEVLYNSVYSGSLFSKKKIIVINEATDKSYKQITNVINKFPENIKLIIISGILEKKSKLRNIFEISSEALCIPCYSDSYIDLKIIAENEMKKNNIILSRESINLLIEKSNNDRNNLRNEIEKIKFFTINKKKIEIDEIQSLINFSGEYKSDSLVNECLCGNISEFKKIISEIYEDSINQISLLRILSIKIHRLLEMKKNEKKYKDLDSLLNTFRPTIFWKEKSIVKKQLILWKFNELKEIIKEINNTELTCKKNPQIAKIIFFNFFNNLCKKANSFS